MGKRVKSEVSESPPSLTDEPQREKEVPAVRGRTAASHQRLFNLLF